MIMRKVFLLLIVLFIASCSGDKYRIKGSYEGAADGTKLYITAIDEFFTPIDSAVVRDGLFSFSGKADTPVVRMLISSVELDGGPIVIENGRTDVILGNGMRRGGSTLNKQLQHFYDKRDVMGRRMESIIDFINGTPSMTASQRDSIQLCVAAAKADFVEMLQRTIGGNMDNALGAFLLTQSEDYFSPDEIYSLMSMVPRHLHDKLFVAMYERVKDEASRKMRAMATSVGGTYINFELPDADGNKVLLSDIITKNRYTLLDFWASWCAPCRQEMPVIRKIYNDYKKSGVAVVSLSVDSSIEEWKEGISSLGMQWVQLCDVAGGSAEVASAYGVERIPTLILIDSEGKIIMRGEPAVRVAERLSELLK